MSKLSVDQDLVRALAKLLEETGLSEIEVESDDERLRLVRAGTGQTMVIAAPAAATVAGAAAAAPAPSGGDESQSLESHPGAVTSPMVGTAYTAPDPNAPPFVQIGDRVRQGQTLLIIEAMKTYNEIPSPRDGTVSRILVENGQPLEFGTVLMLVE